MYTHRLAMMKDNKTCTYVKARGAMTYSEKKYIRKTSAKPHTHTQEQADHR